MEEVKKVYHIKKMCDILLSITLFCGDTKTGGDGSRRYARLPITLFCGDTKTARNNEANENPLSITLFVVIRKKCIYSQNDSGYC